MTKIFSCSSVVVAGNESAILIGIIKTSTFISIDSLEYTIKTDIMQPQRQSIIAHLDKVVYNYYVFRTLARAVGVSENETCEGT